MDITIKDRAHSTGKSQSLDIRKGRFYSPGHVSAVALALCSAALLCLQYYLLEWQQVLYSFLKEGHNLSKIAKKTFGISIMSKREILINEHSFYIINTAILSCISLVLFFAAAYFVHALVFGRGRVYRKRISHELDKLDNLVKNSCSLLSAYENELYQHLSVVGVEPLDNIGITRQVIHALEKRIKEIRRKLADKREDAGFEALTLLHDKLDYRDSCFDSLIQTQDTAQSLRLQVTTRDAFALLETMFKRVDVTTKKALAEVDKYTRKVA